MKRFIHCLWYDTGAGTELASLKDERAAGGRVRVVCRTAKGALFGYEMDGCDASEPTAEALQRFLTIGDAVAWMSRQGFPAESIASAFPNACRDGRGERDPAPTGGRGSSRQARSDVHRAEDPRSRPR